MRVISLLYHDVVDAGDCGSSGFGGADADRYKLEEREFVRHLEAVREAVGPEGVRTLTSVEHRVPDGSTLLTFDDGGASALRIADLLEARGWRGHFFIPTAKLGQPGFLNRGGVRELHMRHHVVGTHSATHPDRLSALDQEAILEEWQASRKTLEDLVGESICLASVPGGFDSPRVQRAAASAGLRVLFNSEPVRRCELSRSLLVIGRFSVQQGTSAATVGRLASGDWRPRVRQYLLWNAKKVLKTAGGGLWLKFRREYFGRQPGRR